MVPITQKTKVHDMKCWRKIQNYSCYSILYAEGVMSRAITLPIVNKPATLATVHYELSTTLLKFQTIPELICDHVLIQMKYKYKFA